jgi:hypothetical protein
MEHIECIAWTERTECTHAASIAADCQAAGDPSALQPACDAAPQMVRQIHDWFGGNLQRAWSTRGGDLFMTATQPLPTSSEKE